MLGPGVYNFFQKTGVISVEWTRPAFPIELTVWAVILLALMPFLFFFRQGVARFADRFLHIHWPPKVFGLVAPIVSLAGGLLLIFVKGPRTALSLEMTTEDFLLQTEEKKVEMRWADVVSATLDRAKETPEEFSLLMKTTDERQGWIPLSWLEKEHQALVLSFINQATEDRFKLTRQKMSPP